MGLFNFFRKAKPSGYPDHYKGIITPGDYARVLEVALRYHSENGLKVIRTGEGEIVAEVNGEEQHRYLDNLVRLLHAGNRSSWSQIVYDHFDKLRDHRPAYNYLFKDFDYAAPLLRVLIKGAALYKNDLDTFVYRRDFPETNTFLVIEYEQQFRYLTKGDIAEWEKAEEELFERAIANTPIGEVEAKEYRYSGKFLVYVFFSGDYSASLMLDLAQRADFAIGTYGSLIAIPTKGTAFVHAIETADIMELVEALWPTVGKFYNEDPGSITTNFYWRYGELIEHFPNVQDGDRYVIRLPGGLQDLLA